MHQLAQHVGGCVRGIFTDTIIVEKPKRTPYFSTEIGGVRISKISKSNIKLEVKPRTKNFIHEKPDKKVLKTIDEFKLENNKVVVFLELVAVVNQHCAINYNKNWEKINMQYVRQLIKLHY